MMCKLFFKERLDDQCSVAVQTIKNIKLVKK